MIISKCRNALIYSSFLLSLFITSCKSTRDVSYFQDLSSEIPVEVFQPNQNHVLKFKVGDILAITVTAIDPNSVAIFNTPVVSYMTPNSDKLSISQQLLTYTIDNNGCVNLPVLGQVKVAGLSRVEVIDLLQNRISKYVNDPIVNVQLVNFRISVLGEVLTPGSYPVDNERVTVLDALAMAGDMTITGNREDICIIRDENGEKKVIKIDLYNSDILTDSAFYVQQNDVIYVRPNRAKSRNARYSQRDSFNISLFSTIVSTVSVLTSLLIALLIK